MNLYKIFQNCAGRVSADVFLFASKNWMMSTMKQYNVSIVSEGQGEMLGKDIARISFPDDDGYIAAEYANAQSVDIRVLGAQSGKIFSGMLEQNHQFVIQDGRRPLMVVESLLFRKPIELIPLHEQVVPQGHRRAFEKA